MSPDVLPGRQVDPDGIAGQARQGNQENQLQQESDDREANGMRNRHAQDPCVDAAHGKEREHGADHWIGDQMKDDRSSDSAQQHGDCAENESGTTRPDKARGEHHRQHGDRKSRKNRENSREALELDHG